MLPKTEAQSETRRILVVEDEPVLRIVLADGLRAAGFAVVEAAGAEDALSCLRAGVPVDLVFSDVQMPGTLDGLALAHRIRCDYPLLPVVLTSGHARLESLGDARPFIPKPYDVDRVVVALREMLGRPSPGAAGGAGG